MTMWRKIMSGERISPWPSFLPSPDNKTFYSLRTWHIMAEFDERITAERLKKQYDQGTMMKAPRKYVLGLFSRRWELPGARTPLGRPVHNMHARYNVYLFLRMARVQRDMKKEGLIPTDKNDN